MALLIIAPTIVRYNVQGVIAGGHNVSNNVDVSIDVNPTKSRHDAIVDFNGVLPGYWKARVLPELVSNYTFTGIDWVDLDSATGETGHIGPGTGTLTGGKSEEAAAPNVSYLIHLNSAAQRGQRQGRMYLMPVREQYVDGAGRFGATQLAALQAAVNNFRSDIDDYTSINVESAAWRTVHVHKPSGTAGDVSTWTWSSSTIDSVQVDQLVASQRRRLR